MILNKKYYVVPKDRFENMRVNNIQSLLENNYPGYDNINDAQEVKSIREKEELKFFKIYCIQTTIKSIKEPKV